MARIIDLKSKKFQPSEPAPQDRLMRPVVKVTAAGPHSIAKPGLQKSPPPLRPVKPEAPEPEAKVLSWSGPLFHHRPNMKVIAAVSLTLFTIAALLQIFQKNIITTIFFGLLGMVILIRAGKKPEVVDFEINPLGVRVGKRLYGFREIKSFWIEYEPMLDVKELSLQLKKWYYAYIKIPIYNQNPAQLRLTLLAFLPEVEHNDTLADAISRKLGL